MQNSELEEDEISPSSSNSILSNEEISSSKIKKVKKKFIDPALEVKLINKMNYKMQILKNYKENHRNFKNSNGYENS